MSVVKVKEVSKSFVKPGGVAVSIMDDFSFSIEKGEVVTLFGPNGCGKSTLLSMLANISDPDEGNIDVSWDRDVKNSVGFVFQNYGDVLHPWASVLDNVSFPLKIQGYPDDEIKKQALKRLAHFGIEEHANKYVYQLSGGQKQLVSFCQATVYKPHLLLCDEPFSAMDYSVSRRLWLQLREFLAERDMATVFVSHDIDEAIFLGDRVLVLSPRPCQIIDEVEIPFGNERSLDLTASEDFFKIRARIIKSFEAGGGK